MSQIAACVACGYGETLQAGPVPAAVAISVYGIENDVGVAGGEQVEGAHPPHGVLAALDVDEADRRPGQPVRWTYCCQYRQLVTCPLLPPTTSLGMPSSSAILRP